MEKNNKHLIGWRFLRLQKETEVPGMFQRGRNHLPLLNGERNRKQFLISGGKYFIKRVKNGLH